MWGNQSSGWLGIGTFPKPEEPNKLIYNFSVGCESGDFYARQKPIWYKYDSQLANNWNHFALVYDSGIVSAYINGILVGSGTQSIVDLDEGLAAIGKHTWSGEGLSASTSLSFLVDEVRIYKIALNSSQIKELSE